jgi:DNA-binding NtrC family response regulator
MRPSLTALSISPIEEDHVALKRICSRPEMELNWAVHALSGLESALPLLRHNRIPVALCERDLAPGSWLDVLEEIIALEDPPLLVVTSRLADERLWAEALNRGGFDVLAKPFDAAEVDRTLASAWRHWMDRHGIDTQRTHTADAPQGHSPAVSLL